MARLVTTNTNREKEEKRKKKEKEEKEKIINKRCNQYVFTIHVLHSRIEILSLQRVLINVGVYREELLASELAQLLMMKIQ